MRTAIRTVEDSKENNSFLDDDGDDDYSEWDAFCETLVVNDRLLNRIRVKCYQLREGALSQRDSIDGPTVISEAAIKEIRRYIHEIEESEKPHV